MKILLVTTVRPTHALVEWAQKDINLPGGRYSLVSLIPSTAPLYVERHLVVENSLLPRRPIRSVATKSRPASALRGARRTLQVGLQSGRTGWRRLPLPATWRAEPGRMLAVACRTVPAVRKAAEAADVVVALDDGAAWGVWELSRLTDRPRFVHRPVNVAQVVASARSYEPGGNIAETPTD